MCNQTRQNIDGIITIYAHDYHSREKVRSDKFTHKFNNNIRCVRWRRQRPYIAGPISASAPYTVTLVTKAYRMPQFDIYDYSLQSISGYYNKFNRRSGPTISLYIINVYETSV